MTKNISRPRSLASEDLDGAVAEALTRVSQARELSKTECDAVSGGAIGGISIELIGPTVGMFPTEPRLPGDDW